MIAKVLMCLLAVMPFTGHVEAGIWDMFFGSEAVPEPKMIKVLIAHDQPGAFLEVKGKYSLYDPNMRGRCGGYKHLSARFLPKRKPIQAVSDGIKWGEVFPGIFQLLLVPEEPTTEVVLNGVSYKGFLYFYNIAETGTISVVNEVLLDDYLASVLSNRIQEKLSEEAAAAVAIAARTNALYYVEHPKNPYWSVDAAEVGYRGQPAVKECDVIAQAIRATKQMVMSIASCDSAKMAFPAEWKLPSQTKSNVQLAKISLQEAESLAQKGNHAAEILKKAFPGSSIQLTP